MQRIKKKKTAIIAALQGRRIRDEVRRGTRAYRATVHPTTGASPNKLMFGENCAESSQKPADKLSTQMTPRSVSVTKSKKRKWRNMPIKEDIQLR